MTAPRLLLLDEPFAALDEIIALGEQWVRQRRIHDEESFSRSDFETALALAAARRLGVAE